MPKGGYKAGGGRPRGVKDGHRRTRPKNLKYKVKPKEKKVEEEVVIKKKLGRPKKVVVAEVVKEKVAKKRVVKERIAKPPVVETKPQEPIQPPIPVTGNAVNEAIANGEELDSLAYAMKIINDPTADPDLRSRLAIAALPYQHARVDGVGKKQAKEDAAKSAGGGRFAQGKPPSGLKLVGSGGGENK